MWAYMLGFVSLNGLTGRIIDKILVNVLVAGSSPTPVTVCDLVKVYYLQGDKPQQAVLFPDIADSID